MSRSLQYIVQGGKPLQLPTYEAGIYPSHCHQVLVGSHLCHLALIHYCNFVGILHRAQPDPSRSIVSNRIQAPSATARTTTGRSNMRWTDLPVCNNDNCPATGSHERIKCNLNRCLAFGIKSGRCLVQKNNLQSLHQRSVRSVAFMRVGGEAEIGMSPFSNVLALESDHQ